MRNLTLGFILTMSLMLVLALRIRIAGGKYVTVKDFSYQYEEKKTLQLKAAFLPIVNLTKCQEDYFLDPLTDKMICAEISTDSSCKGDSGGPGIMDGRLAAVISSGFICDTANAPAVFTAVYKYLDFIHQYVNVKA